MAIACGGAAQERAEINVTPMIDILLVLLIIFLVVAPITAHGLDARAPQADRSGSESTPPIVITVTGGTTVRLNQQVVALADLEQRLRNVFRDQADAVVFVRAERSLEFRQVAAVIDISKGAGINRVGLLTERTAPSLR